MACMRKHRCPDRRVSAESGSDIPRTGRPVGGPPRRGRRHARGFRSRSGAGPRNSTTRGGRSSAASSRMPRTRRWRGSTREWPGELLLVTQNVDDLHERAGSKRLIHMHGELTKGWCLRVRRAVRLGRADGRGRVCPGLRRTAARCVPTSSGSARCRTRWSGSRRRCSAATCSSRSGRRARSIRPPASSRPRAIAARRRWR